MDLLPFPHHLGLEGCLNVYMAEDIIRSALIGPGGRKSVKQIFGELIEEFEGGVLIKRNTRISVVRKKIAQLWGEMGFLTQMDFLRRQLEVAKIYADMCQLEVCKRQSEQESKTLKFTNTPSKET